MIDLSNLSNLHGMEPVELALHWAERGLPVLPCNPDTKAPWVGKGWERKATVNQTEIHAMWYHRPTARVGIKTGLACGCGCEDGPDVLDFDVSEGKPGLEQRRILVDAGILDGTKTLRVATPSGGEHWWFTGTAQHNKQNDDSVWGVDLRAHHGMVLAPGNPGYEVRSVPWDELGKVDWDAVRSCPGILSKPQADRPRVEPPPRRAVVSLPPGRTKLVAPARFDNPVGEESPLDWFCRQNDLGQMLVADGWTYAYTHEERDYYVRPGKDPKDGVSANVMTNPDGRQTLINFSTSVDLPTDRGLSAAQYLAYRDHRGDVREAAKHIRQRLMPQRAVVPTTGLVASPANQDGLAGTDAPPGPARPSESPPGTDLIPVREAGPPQMVVDFWQRRQILHRIRWLARERRVSPWATLGAVLALASCRIGPHVVLPPIVGGVASLNLLVGLVGPSGKGKGAATAVATEFLDVQGRFMVEEVGTSQGIDSSFTETPAKSGPVQFNDVAFFYVPEIDTVKAHAEMAGSSLLPTLRKMWSGEALGAKYAAKERRRPVRAHAYRASVVAGIQPKRSGVLLHDEDGGTPQRWLWLPVTDPAAIRRTDRLIPPPYSCAPPTLDFDVWVPQGEQRGEKDEPVQVEVQPRYEIPVCQIAQDAIIDARELNLISDEASMDSHSLLTRLKVAALLAFLDRRMEVTEDDWQLAEPIMWTSNLTRAECQRALEEAEEEENRRKGRGRAMVAMAEAVATPALKDRRAERIQEIGGKALRILQDSPGQEYSPKQIREAVMDARTQREFATDVLAALVATPGVVQGPEVSRGGRKIRMLSWQPVIG